MSSRSCNRQPSILAENIEIITDFKSTILTPLALQHDGRHIIVSTSALTVDLKLLDIDNILLSIEHLTNKKSRKLPIP